MHIIIIAAVWVAFSVMLGQAGRSFRFGFWGNFFASLLLTPIIGSLLVLAAIPVRKSKV